MLEIYSTRFGLIFTKELYLHSLEGLLPAEKYCGGLSEGDWCFQNSSPWCTAHLVALGILLGIHWRAPDYQFKHNIFQFSIPEMLILPPNSPYNQLPLQPCSPSPSSVHGCVSGTKLRPEGSRAKLVPVQSAAVCLSEQNSSLGQSSSPWDKQSLAFWGKKLALEKECVQSKITRETEREARAQQGSRAEKALKVGRIHREDKTGAWKKTSY